MKLASFIRSKVKRAISTTIQIACETYHTLFDTTVLVDCTTLEDLPV